eukprot:5108806-Amphidinium_carterae.1
MSPEFLAQYMGRMPPEVGGLCKCVALHSCPDGPLAHRSAVGYQAKSAKTCMSLGTSRQYRLDLTARVWMPCTPSTQNASLNYA